MAATPRQRLRRLSAELGTQPAILATFGICAADIIARTALLSVPERFAGGQRIGDVLYELSIAYVVAWLFNMLVVVLPRLRNQDVIILAIGLATLSLSAVGLRAQADLGRAAGLQVDPMEQFDEFWFREVGSGLHWQEESHLMLAVAGVAVPGTWLDWLRVLLSDADRRAEALMGYLPVLETELLRDVTAVVHASFLRQARLLVNLGLPVRGNVGTMAKQIAEYVEACQRLHTRYEALAAQAAP